MESAGVRAALIRSLTVAALWGAAFGQVPVTDPLVKEKCGRCHAADDRGNLERISWQRTTPEIWQDVLRKMIALQRVTLTQPEARSILKYLSDSHGLAPEEAQPILYDAERRVHEETNVPDEKIGASCTRCHTFARALSVRRSEEEWKTFAASHAQQYRVSNDDAIAFLSKAAALNTPEWRAWSSRDRTQKLDGRWLANANLPGHGWYYGDMVLTSSGATGEFITTATLKSVADGSTVKRSGVVVIYGDYAWRGRSKGDPAGEAREVMWVAPDRSRMEGRWYWGQYQELGFDVRLQRASSQTTILRLDRTALKTGAKGVRVRLIGDNFPSQFAASDLNFGAGITVRGVVARTATEITVEVDCAADAEPGKRTVFFRSIPAPDGIAVYDRVDYIVVVPDSSLAAFGDQKRMRGYQQFEAIGYHRGADGRAHTDDDVPLGPVEVAWSLQEFYSPEGTNFDHIGKLSDSGFFTPSEKSPNNNFDVWVIASAKTEREKDGQPMVGKGSMVVTVPEYTFRGRRYVRDLDRWVDDGPVREAK